MVRGHWRTKSVLPCAAPLRCAGAAGALHPQAAVKAFRRASPVGVGLVVAGPDLGQLVHMAVCCLGESFARGRRVVALRRSGSFWPTFDLDGAVAPCGSHEFLDAPSGLVFDPVADGQGGEHDR